MIVLVGKPIPEPMSKAARTDFLTFERQKGHTVAHSGGSLTSIVPSYGTHTEYAHSGMNNATKWEKHISFLLPSKTNSRLCLESIVGISSQAVCSTVKGNM